MKDVMYVISDTHTGYAEGVLTADEEVGSCSREEQLALGQGADQATDPSDQQQDQAEREQHHDGSVHACAHTHTHTRYCCEEPSPAHSGAGRRLLTQHVQLSLGVPGVVRCERVDGAGLRLPSWTSQFKCPL